MCFSLKCCVSFVYQFWSPLLMTEEARHSFSLTDQGSVGPTFSILCSAGRRAETWTDYNMTTRC